MVDGWFTAQKGIWSSVLLKLIYGHIDGSKSFRDKDFCTHAISKKNYHNPRSVRT